MGHQSIIEMQRHELVFMDNPRHRSLRNLIGEAITPAAVQSLRPRIAEHVAEKLRPLRARGQMDVIGDFALTLPTEIAAIWLGVPAGDRPQIVEWIFPWSLAAVWLGTQNPRRQPTGRWTSLPHTSTIS